MQQRWTRRLDTFCCMSSRAPGTRREKGFLIERAKALRSTELAIRQVGWDGGTCLATTELAGVWHNAVVTGCRAIPDGEGAMDPVHPTRARGWVLGPEGGLHPRFPGPSSEPNGRWAEGVKVWYRFRVPCVNNGLVWAGGQAGRENRAGEVGGICFNSRLVYVFPYIHM